jgi:hypothetical protein
VGIIAPYVLRPPSTASASRADVEQMLATTLRQDDIALLDNLTSRKAAGVAVRAGVRQAIT